MTDNYPEPANVAQQVDSWVSDQFRNARKWENSELLDDNGTFTLHRLAASIYAQGHAAGEQVERNRANEQLRRELDRQSEEATR